MDMKDIEILKKYLHIFFEQYKISEKVFIFGNDGINKNAFHKRKQPIDINKIDIKEQQYLVKIHMAIKSLLD